MDDFDDIDDQDDENEVDGDGEGDVGEGDEESDGQSICEVVDYTDEPQKLKPNKTTKTNHIRTKPSELNMMERTAILSFRINELSNYTGYDSIGEMTYLTHEQLSKLGPITVPPFYYMQKIAIAEFGLGLLAGKLGVIRLKGDYTR